MSLFNRIWNAIRNPVRLIGRDFEGNKYFESRSNNDPSRMKRTVQYQNPDAMWDYIGGGRRLPVQWSAWLTHTRQHPPTLEELETDLIRQRRVLFNALKIDEKDKAEAEEMNRLRQHGAHTAIEDAIISRTVRTRLESGSNDSKVTETQEIPSVHFPKVQPPRYVTPMPKVSKLSSESSVDYFPHASKARTNDADPHKSNGQSQTINASPWKATPSDTESWSPKARKRE